MFHSFATLVIFGTVWILAQGQQTGDENCETLPFQLHLIKGFKIVDEGKALKPFFGALKKRKLELFSLYQLFNSDFS